MSQTAAEEEATYADGTTLVSVLGTPARVRILAVLTSETDRDLNPTEIMEEAGIGSTAFYEHIDDLRAWGLVEKTRMAGNSPMFRLNMDSEAAQHLGKFEWELVKHSIEKEEAGELDENEQPILSEE
ncbi:winged helix-turn-helix domain-containing protein [Halocatena marina]|uniref:winged helix-turn-helix domain-containing protein n=1 Tax=Halocatena marina TaxID=2934937 RepID=UPI00200F77C0|nr:winged helix-turn-helix domain-containing protein [Halocatena marina]